MHSAVAPVPRQHFFWRLAQYYVDRASQELSAEKARGHILCAIALLRALLARATSAHHEQISIILNASAEVKTRLMLARILVDWTANVAEALQLLNAIGLSGKASLRPELRFAVDSLRAEIFQKQSSFKAAKALLKTCEDESVLLKEHGWYYRLRMQHINLLLADDIPLVKTVLKLLHEAIAYADRAKHQSISTLFSIFLLRVHVAFSIQLFPSTADLFPALPSGETTKDAPESWHCSSLDVSHRVLAVLCCVSVGDLELSKAHLRALVAKVDSWIPTPDEKSGLLELPIACGSDGSHFDHLSWRLLDAESLRAAAYAATALIYRGSPESNKTLDLLQSGSLLLQERRKLYRESLYEFKNVHDGRKLEQYLALCTLDAHLTRSDVSAVQQGLTQLYCSRGTFLFSELVLRYAMVAQWHGHHSKAWRIFDCLSRSRDAGIAQIAKYSIALLIIGGATSKDVSMASKRLSELIKDLRTSSHQPNEALLHLLQAFVSPDGAVKRDHLNAARLACNRTGDQTLLALILLTFAETVAYTEVAASHDSYKAAYAMFRSWRAGAGSIVAGKGVADLQHRIEAQIQEKTPGVAGVTGAIGLVDDAHVRERKKREKKNAMIRMQYMQARAGHQALTDADVITDPPAKQTLVDDPFNMSLDAGLAVGRDKKRQQQT